MIRKLKNIFLVAAMIFMVCWGYVLIVNRNSINMTGRQKVIKALYPVLVWVNKITNKNVDVLTHEKLPPPVPFYSLNVILNDSTMLNMASLKGKKVLLVNTASECGYTPQYDQLQKLYGQYGDRLVIIGFPANDFKEQEKGSDASIASFCKKNYGVSFPLAQKSIVVKTAGQHAVFQWLTDPAKNGWNSTPPSWNFSKYLINEEGMLIDYFGPGVEPTGPAITGAIK